AVCAAAVADWRVSTAQDQKIKKKGKAPSLSLVENPDILRTLSTATGNRRPALVVGFGAETENVVENAVEKRRRKGCDWLLANDVSPESGTFGGDSNRLFLIRDGDVEDWPRMSKSDAAGRLAQNIADHFRDLPMRNAEAGA
ncbi:MAG: phosphopantothenoylcysteine decarboxylase, partial [Pseudomonadota bacterium]